ncbi:MAG TPA: acyltransferase [Baekduia sp.]|nr:acyltransferase [Baekduia sp.]
MSRLRAIDGLRGVAALSVLAYHAWLYSLPRVSSSTRETAFDSAAHELRLGLVLFFVLSGYLLFGPWVRSALEDRPGPRLRPYALRRAARILPAYWVALVGSIALVWPIEGTAGVRLPPAEDLWLFAVLGQNFKEATLLKLDPPMWTLTVEATFYLALPVLGAVALALRGRGGRWTLAAVPLAFLALGVAWNWWIAERDLPLTVTKVLPAMAPYFAVGMLAAVAAHGRTAGSRARGWLLVAGALLVAGDAVWHGLGAAEGSSWVELRIVRDLPAAAGFALVVAASATAASVPRILGSAPLARAGLWSYGLYLWHVPVLVWLRSKGLLPSDALLALAVAAPPSLALAALSWRYVEEPALSWARQRSWASRPGSTVPVPSHQGQSTVEGEPPRFETTFPVPRQGGHGVGAGVSGSSSAALKARARVAPFGQGTRS